MTRSALIAPPSSNRSAQDAPSPSAASVLPELERAQLLRSVAAEVASAIAHAAGTPLNVITGRAELIRQDASNAALHAQRIEEQVRRLANGFRQLVDYLALPEAPADDTPAAQVLSEVVAQVQPFAQSRGVELALEAAEFGEATVDRAHVTCVLCLLLEWAAGCAARFAGAQQRRLLVTGSSGEDSVSFDVEVPGLELLSGWRIEHFEPRPEANASADAYRMLSVCGALARGRGARLSTEAAHTGTGVRVRLSCVPGVASNAERRE